MKPTNTMSILTLSTLGVIMKQKYTFNKLKLTRIFT